MTVRELIQQARIDRVEAEILLADVLGVERAWLFAHGEDPVAEPALNLFTDHANARHDGAPLAYVLGYRDFRSLRLGRQSSCLDSAARDRAFGRVGDRVH
jgi:release factor glutamine methyltransferase